MWSFAYRENFSACKIVVLEHSTTNQMLVYVHKSLLTVYNGSISCLFHYTTLHQTSLCPTCFLVNFRCLHQFIVDTSKETRLTRQNFTAFHLVPQHLLQVINSHEEFNVTNLPPCKIKHHMILFSQVNLSARKTRYTVQV